MTTLRIDGFESDLAGPKISASLSVGEVHHKIDYQSDDIALTPNPESLLSLALLPAMKQRASIQYEAQVSPRFITGLASVQELVLETKTNYRKVAVTGLIPIPKEASSQGRVGLFFSGGLDSYYSLLSHQGEISDLIFVHGFDKPVEEDYSKTSLIFREVAAQFGIRFIEVKSNLSGFMDRYIGWGLVYGAAMASVGHLLYPSFRRIYMAASRTLDVARLSGVHYRMDPQWSTEGLEFVHDGEEANRIQKAALVSPNELAMKTLRVCMAVPEGQKNCGKCEKCVRTMLNLKAVGALERCPAFEAPLDYRRIWRIYGLNNDKHAHAQQILTALEESGADPKMESFLRMILSTPKIIPWSHKRLRQLKIRMRGRRQIADLIMNWVYQQV